MTLVQRLGATLLALASAALALKLVDVVVGRLPYDAPVYRASSRKGLLTLELYPYEGWHLPASLHHQGDLPRETQSYHDYDIRTGSMGFFVDFDLNHPPQKAPGEYRVVLTGGSGAQGWGARDNESMLYNQLERRLNERLRGKPKVRVINLAMAGSVAYQNFIALNRYAHPLQPDLIVAYIGFNDVKQLYDSRSDAFYQFPELDSLVLASRASEFPGASAALRAFLPNLMTRTSVGLALKVLLARGALVDEARRGYENDRGVAYSRLAPDAFVDATTVDQAVLALRSIKRDFLGVPILVVWQPVGHWDRAFAREAGLRQDFYDRAFDEIVKGVSGYLNGGWAFVDLNRTFAADPRPYFGIHLSNEGHRIVAGLLADRVLALMRRPTRRAGSD